MKVRVPTSRRNRIRRFRERRFDAEQQSACRPTSERSIVHSVERAQPVHQPPVHRSDDAHGNDVAASSDSAWADDPTARSAPATARPLATQHGGLAQPTQHGRIPAAHGAVSAALSDSRWWAIVRAVTGIGPVRERDDQRGPDSHRAQQATAQAEAAARHRCKWWQRGLAPGAGTRLQACKDGERRGGASVVQQHRLHDLQPHCKPGREWHAPGSTVGQLPEVHPVSAAARAW